MIALSIGFLLVIIYMFIKYRIFGLITNITLIFNLIILLGVLTLFKSRLDVNRLDSGSVYGLLFWPLAVGEKTPAILQANNLKMMSFLWHKNHCIDTFIDSILNDITIPHS